MTCENIYTKTHTRHIYILHRKKGDTFAANVPKRLFVAAPFVAEVVVDEADMIVVVQVFFVCTRGAKALENESVVIATRRRRSTIDCMTLRESQQVKGI
jgi:hypothetical protein